jgi:hypothetical protein
VPISGFGHLRSRGHHPSSEEGEQVKDAAECLLKMAANLLEKPKRDFSLSIRTDEGVVSVSYQHK